MARWVGLKKSYVINRVGLAKILCLLTRWVGGSKKGLKHAYVIFEWSLIMMTMLKFYQNITKFQIQLRAFDYIRLPFYEAKVLFSEGRGRM